MMEIIVPGPANLAVFVSAALVLLLVPGPAVLYIFARSVEQGRHAGFVSMLGIHTATLVHVSAAVLGLSAILASSALAFSLIKYAGAAYLIWLGLKKIFGRREAIDIDVNVRGNGYWRLFRDGFVVNLLKKSQQWRRRAPISGSNSRDPKQSSMRLQIAPWVGPPTCSTMAKMDGHARSRL
jgi:LysE type translocator